MLLTDSNAVLCLRSALLLRLNVHLLALVQPSSAALQHVCQLHTEKSQALQSTKP